MGRLLKRLPKDPRAPALPDFTEREEAAIDFGGQVVESTGRYMPNDITYTSIEGTGNIVNPSGGHVHEGPSGEAPMGVDMFTGEMRENPAGIEPEAEEQGEYTPEQPLDDDEPPF